MTWQQRIIIDPEILVGKPVIRGTRLAVEFSSSVSGFSRKAGRSKIFWTITPGLTSEDIKAYLA